MTDTAPKPAAAHADTPTTTLKMAARGLDFHYGDFQALRNVVDEVRFVAVKRLEKEILAMTLRNASQVRQALAKPR